MGSTHVIGTRRMGSQLKAGDIVVVQRSIKGGEPTLIKLKQAPSYNALGWKVWDFSVIVGVPKFNEYAVASDFDVEVCMPLVDVAETFKIEPEAVKLPFVYRPYHVYVEESEGTSVYNVYKFTRQELARDVMGCAKRFGLQSFIVPVFKPVGVV